MSDKKDNQIRILVVDDENIVLSLVRDALEEEDFNVMTAANGSEALKIIESQRIDLMVTDIRMPGIDGIELVRKSRAVQPDVSIIYMTGYANLNSAKDAIKQGAFDYILKPFELDEIRRAVKGAVQKIRKEAAEKSPSQQLDRLSDLNQMLFSVGDRRTLCFVSLRFAMMHCQADCGAVIFWNRAMTDIKLITIVSDHIQEETVPEHPLVDYLTKIDVKQLQQPAFVSRIDEHPLYKACSDSELTRYLFPPCVTEDVQMVTVPVSRTEALFALIMVGFPDDSALLKAADLKLLSIGANQLAMSLENLELLEQTQEAYGRLKELQDKTIQLEKMATRGEMSVEIGHELNNFLGVVSGNLSLLEFQLKKGNHTELEKHVRAIADNIEKIEKFTSNLIELTPISSKKEAIYFDTLLTEVTDYLKPQKRFQGVKINVLPADHHIPFEADSLHIQQLLYNLFNNAADATTGCHTREISVQCEINPDRDTFSFRISDTGVGIEQELASKLFQERFTTKQSGHGFGLVVCKRIVDNHGGKISIESTPGQGTTIRIDFPLAKPEPALVATP